MRYAAAVDVAAPYLLMLLYLLRYGDMSLHTLMPPMPTP